MLRTVLLSLALLLVGNFLLAQDGYEIKVKLNGFTESEILLANYYGDKQYIKDTVQMNPNGYFVFKGEEALEPGVYLIVMPPENQFLQVMINKGEQHFMVETDVKDPVNGFKSKNTADNELFYNYLKFLGEQRIKGEALKKRLEEASAADKPALEKEMEIVNQAVRDRQRKLVDNNPNSVTKMMIQSGVEPEAPKFDLKGDELKRKNFEFYKKHWFDNYEMGNPAMLRSPGLHRRIDYYVNKMTLQHPDSVAVSVDYVLELLSPSEESFKYYVVHFLNEAAKSKIVGMDALYVYIVEKYYMTGKAKWTEEEQLNKIIKNAKTLMPILVGKIAPDIKMQLLDVEETIKAKEVENAHKRVKTKGMMTLHEVKSPYTVLFFWDPDCGHCKKSMPKLLEFYDKFKPRGVEVFAVCTRTYKEVPACAQMIKDKGMTKWINVVDPYLKSKFKITYDVRTTPQIFVLDEKKEIISKRIGAEQLEELMERILTTPPPAKE
ncbi:MAG: thioredoxin-like domain-containing protein [Saprospiraceae bacterium]